MECVETLVYVSLVLLELVECLEFTNTYYEVTKYIPPDKLEEM